MARQRDLSVSHQLSMRRRSDWLLLVADVGSTALVCWVAYLLRFEGDPVPAAYVHRYRIATVIAAVMYVLTGRLAGLYRRAALRVGDSQLPAAFETAVATGLLVLVANYVVLDGKISRAW